jgi:O-Antigen ligase
VKTFFCCILVIAIFGQPNALAVLVPVYPSIAFVINILFIFFVIIRKSSDRETLIFNTNILIPIFAFIFYSFVSLSFAPDPQFGFRILLSTIFKLILFIQITSICYELNFIKALLKTVSLMGTVFSAQAIILTLAISIFKIQPSESLNTAGGAGLLDYDYKMLSYGILGFGKQFVDLYGLNFPRFQAMFAEPGYFSNFLELSIFSTIGYNSLRKFKKQNNSNTQIIIQFIALLGSFSTAGWFSTFCGYFIYLICCTIKKSSSSKELKRFVTIFTLLLIVFIAFTSAFPTVADEVYKIVWAEKFETDWGSSSAVERADQVGLGQSLFLQRPIGGWGSNQMRIIADGTGANNSLVTVAVELGTIGVFIYLSMIFAMVRTIISNYKMSISQSISIVNLNAASSGCVVALIVHSMFIDSGWTFYYWIGIGCLYSINIFLKKRLTLSPLMLDKTEDLSI